MKFSTAGDLLKEYRRLLKITQSDLCMDNININTLSKIENNKIRVNPVLAALLSNNLRAISNQKGIKLDISTNDLLVAAEKQCETWCINKLSKLKEDPSDPQTYDVYTSIISNANEYGLEKIALEAAEQFADFLYSNDKYEEAIEYYNVCLDKYKKANKLQKLLEIMCNIGKCFYKIDIDEAYEYYMKIYNQIKNMTIDPGIIEIKARVLYNIALFHSEKLDYQKSNKYIDELTKLYGINNILIVKLYILKGNNEIGENRYSAAAETFNNLLKLPEKEISCYKHIIYNSLAICLYYQHDTENALKYFDFAIGEQLKNSLPSLTLYLLNAASAYLDNSKTDIALRYVDGAIHNAKVHKQPENIVDCYHMQYKIYKYKKYFDKCTTLLKECASYIDMSKLSKEYIYKNELFFIDLAYEKQDYEYIKTVLDRIVRR